MTLRKKYLYEFTPLLKPFQEKHDEIKKTVLKPTQVDRLNKPRRAKEI